MKASATAWTHIRRSPYQAWAAILSMFLTFLVGGIFGLTSLSSFYILKYFESKPQVTVFFSEKAGETEAEKLNTALVETEKVSSTKFVSKDEALSIYKEQNKNDPLLLEMVTADILPASLEVSAKDPRYLKDLEPIMKNAEGVEEVVFQKDVVDTLLKWTDAIRMTGGIFGILLAINALLTVMTITAMKVALKKDEVEILKLIGASQWYIRFPFMLEGSIYGVIGSTTAFILIMGLLLWGRMALLSFVGMIPAIGVVIENPFSSAFILFSLAFYCILTVIGAFLGGIGSYVALIKYIKFK